MSFLQFVMDAVAQVFRGGRSYWTFMLLMVALFVLGIFSYITQFQQGGIVGTGLSEEVPWGIYIANFAFLVGVAAAAVMLVIPAYIFNQTEIKNVTLIGEGMAVAACIMCIMFILSSLGRPDRLWHILPLIGRLNFPRSMLAWDVFVINAYLFLNISIPVYILYSKYCGREPRFKVYFPAVVVAIAFAISIHTVTAFLFSSNVSRPFWHSAILGPRFLASAFSSGPALVIIALQMIEKRTDLNVDSKVITTLALIMTVCLQINMFLLGVEAYTEFYSQTKHSASIEYLFFGLKGYHALVPWIWGSITLNMIAVLILSIHTLRTDPLYLNLACILVVIGIWIEKGMGLVVPGFIPSPLGDIVEYVPTFKEIGVCIGIWAFGAIIFTILMKMAIPIETGRIKGKAQSSPGTPHERATQPSTAA